MPGSDDQAPVAPCSGSARGMPECRPPGSRAHRTCSGGRIRYSSPTRCRAGGPRHFLAHGSCGGEWGDEVFLTLLPDGVFSLRQTYRDAQCAPQVTLLYIGPLGHGPGWAAAPARQRPGVAAAADHRRPPNAQHPRSRPTPRRSLSIRRRILRDWCPSEIPSACRVSSVSHRVPSSPARWYSCLDGTGPEPCPN